MEILSLHRKLAGEWIADLGRYKRRPREENVNFLEHRWSIKPRVSRFSSTPHCNDVMVAVATIWLELSFARALAAGERERERERVKNETMFIHGVAHLSGQRNVTKGGATPPPPPFYRKKQTYEANIFKRLVSPTPHGSAPVSLFHHD